MGHVTLCRARAVTVASAAHVEPSKQYSFEKERTKSEPKINKRIISFALALMMVCSVSINVLAISNNQYFILNIQDAKLKHYLEAFFGNYSAIADAYVSPNNVIYTFYDINGGEITDIFWHDNLKSFNDADWNTLLSNYKTNVYMATKQTYRFAQSYLSKAMPVTKVSTLEVNSACTRTDSDPTHDIPGYNYNGRVYYVISGSITYDPNNGTVISSTKPVKTNISWIGWEIEMKPFTVADSASSIIATNFGSAIFNYDFQVRASYAPAGAVWYEYGYGNFPSSFTIYAN